MCNLHVYQPLGTNLRGCPCYVLFTIILTLQCKIVGSNTNVVPDIYGIYIYRVINCQAQPKPQLKLSWLVEVSLIPT